LSNQKNIDLPKITIIIPAKNEAAVIEHTIDAFTRLNYPKNKYHLLLILDDKELTQFPYEQTTHYFVEKKKKMYNKVFGCEFIISTSVPKNFDGNFNGQIKDTEVPSNKPRALNWGLKFVPQDSQIIGFYDADSSPESDTLLYVAYKYLTQPEQKILLQGSVIQTRNYHNIKPLNKIYALYQAITHEWYLPILLTQLPFIGGTNFFIDKGLICAVGGFDTQSLSEDLEIGLRLFLKENVWPEFMPYINLEQTPPDYKSYFYQRARWATGYLQITEKLIKHESSLEEKIYLLWGLFFYGFLPLAFTQLISLFSIGAVLVSILGIVHVYEFFPSEIKMFFFIMNIFYLLFTIFYFERAKNNFYIKIKVKHTKNMFLKNILNYIEILVLPVAALLSWPPYAYGIFKGLFSNGNLRWKKTPRTKE
jgi:cellulose synthase/poly-beta-1,6-N-acetylglucosamine synthase-like glycosyltransferase